MCENNDDKGKKFYVSLKIDWRGYLVDSPFDQIDYGGSAKYSPSSLQKLVDFAITRGIDYSFLQERKINYTAQNSNGYSAYSRN